jgi:hypothetical protein
MTKLTEKEFLIGLALRHFNEQYSKNILVAECDIRSIPLRYAFNRSYEIFTKRGDDNVRLHMHIRFEGKDGLSKYRVEVDYKLTETLGSTGSLTDEVYVTTGTIDPYYIEQGIYKFLPINENILLNPILLAENGVALVLESGNEILLESAT